MPSEKSRYMNRNRGPEGPFELLELQKYLLPLEAARMAQILWVRAQYDEVLRKALMAVAGLRLAGCDWEKAKAAIDYAFHLPGYVRYDEPGYEQIIETVLDELEFLAQSNQRQFALRVAAYVLERGEPLSENFEDDFGWVSALKRVEEWIKTASS